MMSTEHNFTQGSRQYTWMEQDLQQVDRHTTPWVVVGGHRAMYTSQKVYRKLQYWGNGVDVLWCGSAKIISVLVVVVVVV